MKWDSLERKIKSACRRGGKDSDFTEKFIVYARSLYEKGLPIISSPLNLSLLVGVDHDYVCSMANATSAFYRSFTIKKANGKNRVISEPLPDLKHVQKWILENILEKCSVSPFAKAFVKNRNLKSNARFHRKQPVVVTLDIKDFFPSITVFDVHDIFREMGYLNDVAWFLANLCCLNGTLPQGAPTSPYLSNLRMRSFDNDIADYIKSRSIRYTRYADDLTFSGNFNPHILIHEISKMLYKHGFKMNPDKTRVARSNTRQEVTGIVVNDHMQIPKAKRKHIRQQVYYIKKFGINSHLEHIQEDRKHYLEHLLGHINFALFVNPNDKEMCDYFEYIVSLVKCSREEYKWEK